MPFGIKKFCYSLSNTAFRIFCASFILSCILTAITGGLYYNQARKALLKSMQNQAAILCDSAKNEFASRYSNTIRRQLYFLSSLPQFEKYFMSSKEGFLVNRAELEKAFLIVSKKSDDCLMTAFFDANGNEIISVSGNKRTRYHRKLAQSDAEDITGRQIGRMFDRLKNNSSMEFTCSRPFHDENNKVGFIAAVRKQEPEAGGFGGIIVQHYDISNYIDNVAGRKFYNTTVVWVYGRYGSLRFAPQANINNVSLKSMLASKQKDWVYTAECKVSENTPPIMTVVYSIPEQLISNQLKPVILSVVVIFSLLTAASLGMSVLISKWISKPITELTKAAKNLVINDMALELPEDLLQSRGEIGILVHTVTKMLSTIRDNTTSIDNLNREIAERKRAEEMMKCLNSKLEDANNELKNFAYIASHDLREPLRTILSFGMLLEKSLTDKIDPDDTENLQFVLNGAKRMGQMIDGLLSYSRVNTKGQEFETVELAAILDELIEFDIGALLRETHTKINVPHPLPTIYADPLQIRQLLQNLIANGVKYQPKGNIPEITITSKPAANNMVRIEITDNGIGVAPEYHSTMFTMFKRLPNSKDYEGTGIGLAVCKKITERHNGQIGVESQVGKGSTFWFTVQAANVLSCAAVS